jgi:hypothetical protein
MSRVSETMKQPRRCGGGGEQERHGVCPRCEGKRQKLYLTYVFAAEGPNQYFWRCEGCRAEYVVAEAAREKEVKRLQHDAWMSGEGPLDRQMHEMLSGDF